jgi:hypothetical protein
MGSRHPAASGIAQQNRQAIGHHDGASHIRGRADARIGLEPVWHRAVKQHAVCPMNLLQKHRSSPQGVLQAGTIGQNVGDLVPHMVTQIHAVVRHP